MASQPSLGHLCIEAVCSSSSTITGPGPKHHTHAVLWNMSDSQALERKPLLEGLKLTGAELESSDEKTQW